MATPTTPQICYVSCKQNQHLKPPQSSHHCVSQLFCHTFAKSVRSRASSKHVPRTTEFIPAIPALSLSGLWDGITQDDWKSSWCCAARVFMCLLASRTEGTHISFFQKCIYISSILGEMLTKLCIWCLDDMGWSWARPKWEGMNTGRARAGVPRSLQKES